jgi:HlyD family secretion protein
MERSKSLFERDLLPRQTFDDTDARYQAAQAQLELSMAQLEQTRSRLEELKINLQNTIITAPVEGFIGKRTLDPGASVGANTSFMSVVDIRTVRLVINVVEKDLRRIQQGTAVEVEVDAYPGENFMGRVARLAPILDPATRTAQVEIEIPNSTYRLKPGMYARARFTVEKHDNTLVVPTLAVVDLQGKLGVWVPADEGDNPVFNPVTIGIEQQDFTEITSGVKDGQRIITTGAGSLRPGDRIVMAGERGGRAGGGTRAGGTGRGGRRGGGAAGVNANQGQQQQPAK